MAHVSTISDHSTPFFGNLVRMIKSAGNAMLTAGEKDPRILQAKALMALSDSELAARGLKRSEIARYVFADRYWM